MFRHIDDADYEDEPEFDPDDLPPVDLEIMRDARREQDRFAANPSYGPEPFETIEDANGHTIVKSKLTSPSLSELLLLAKIKRAESEVKAARSSPPPRSDAVRALFGKTKRDVANETKPGASGSDAELSWWQRHFGTPKKSKWI